MTGVRDFSFMAFLDGAFSSLLWSAVGFAAWWVMFRAPLGRRPFRARILVKAPAERIWAACLTEPSPPGGWSGALEISRQGFEGGDPPDRHRAFVRHGGDGPFRESRWRVRRYVPNRLFEAEQLAMEGAKPGSVERTGVRLKLTPQGEAVLVEHETTRLARGVFGHLYVPRASRRFLEHVRSHCEGLDAAPHRAVVSRRASFFLAVLAFAAIVGIFSAGNPEVWGVAAFVAIFLQLAIWLHEYGHLVAMRWFGHADAAFMMVPLLGGAAINARRSKTRFEEAVIALMGPALSGAVVLALTPFVPWGLRFFTSAIGAEPMNWLDLESLATWAGLCAIAFLAMAIPINLYNLVPLGALDGGRVVSALARGRVSQALLASAIFGALAFALVGTANAVDLGAALAFVVIVWVVGQLTSEGSLEQAPPMSLRETCVTLALLIVTLTVYVDASRSITPAVLAALREGVGGGVDQDKADGV